MTEQELLKLNEFAKKHLGKVLSHLKIPRYALGVDDLSQEFLLAVWSGKAVVPAALSTDRFNAWIFCVLRNIAINRLKLTRRSADSWHEDLCNFEGDARHTLSKEDSGFVGIETGEFFEKVYKFLEKIEMRSCPGITYADIFRLKVDGYSIYEIADIYGWKKVKVKAVLAQINIKIKKEFRKYR